MIDILVVSFGAVLGANIRFFIYEKLEKMNMEKEFRILIINTFSCFLLGLFLSFMPRVGSLKFADQFLILISVGLLGSLSSFSTFVYDLFQLCLSYKLYKTLKMLFITLFFGVLSLLFGLVLGK